MWATSWGVSTRLLGGMVMTHSDDKGLVLPPPVAPVQVAIVPITKGKGEEHDSVMQKAAELAAALKAKKIRVQIDDRSNMRPGAKYFEWERKGLPLRLDIGPRDLQGNKCSAALRHTGEKFEMSIESLDSFTAAVEKALQQMHAELYEAAAQRLQQSTFRMHSYEEMKSAILAADQGDRSKAGFYLVPWRCDAANEEAIKSDCKATVRCYPLTENLQPPAEGVKCFYSGEQATHMAIFARAF